MRGAQSLRCAHAAIAEPVSHAWHTSELKFSPDERGRNKRIAGAWADPYSPDRALDSADMLIPRPPHLLVSKRISGIRVLFAAEVGSYPCREMTPMGDVPD